jgi:hypothetical protein
MKLIIATAAIDYMKAALRAALPDIKSSVVLPVPA